MRSRTPRRLSAGLAATAITFSGLAALAGPASADTETVPLRSGCTGAIQAFSSSGDSLGFMRFDGNFYRFGSGRAGAARFILTTGDGQNLVDLAAPPSVPNLGMATGSQDRSLQAGSDAYTLAVRTSSTPPGSSSVPGENTWFGSARVESAVWSVDKTTGDVSAKWINPDGKPATAQIFDQGSLFGLTGDVAAFTRTFGPANVITLRADCDRSPQAITFGRTAPETAYVGRRYATDATSELGTEVTLSSDTPDVCSVDGGTYTFLEAGTCTVVATAPGDDEHLPGRATQTIAVTAIPTTITLAPGFDAYSGRATSLFATVGLPDGVPGDLPTGTVQFSLDGEDLGDPVTVKVEEQFSGRARASSIDFTRKAGDHDIAATFVPDDDVTYAGSSLAGTQGVAQSTTTTKAAVTPTQLTATVTGLEGTTAPAGDVLFRVGEDEVGTAPVVNGKAVLDHVLAAGQGYSVSAEYLGDSETLGSSDSTLRNDPFISAEETSAEPKSEAGWYRTPVTIDYACESGGADLVDDCPASDLLDQEGADQSVTRTIRAVDGGIASVTSTVSLDRTAPTVALKGVKAGQRYFAKAPTATCVGADVLSGLDSCTVTTSKGRNGAETVTATATDHAGNVARTSTSYVVVKQALAGATYRNGAWEVRKGRVYTVQSVNGSRPTYRLAASTPARLARSATRSMTRTGKDTWAIGAIMTMPRTTSGTWYLGVQQGRSITPVKVRLIG